MVYYIDQKTTFIELKDILQNTPFLYINGEKVNFYNYIFIREPYPGIYYETLLDANNFIIYYGYYYKYLKVYPKNMKDRNLIFSRKKEGNRRCILL